MGCDTYVYRGLMEQSNVGMSVAAGFYQSLVGFVLVLVANLLVQSSNSNVSSAAANIPSTGIQMAIAFVAILPIMLIYPTFQKYYAKGITMGGVKG